MKTFFHSKKIYILFFLYIISLNLIAQPAFMNVYHALIYPLAFSVKPTGDHGFIFIGQARDSSINIRNSLMVKTDSSGTLQWGKIYSSTVDAIPLSVISTNDKGYLVTGFIDQGGTAVASIILLKTDSLGTIQWARSFGGATYNAGLSVIETPDTGFIVVGTYYTQHNNIFIMKTDAVGNLTWSKVYNSFLHSEANDIRQTPDAAYIISGSEGANDGFSLLKIDTAGNLLWSKLYDGGSATEYVYDVRVTNDSGFILCGYTRNFGAGNEDAFLMKTDSLGNITWSKAYGKTVHDIGKEVALCADGGYILAGYKEDNAVIQNATIIKTDPSGNVDWSKRLDFFNASNDLYSIASTPDSGFILCGTMGWGPFNDVGTMLIKTNQTGNPSCYDLAYTVTTTNAPFVTSAYPLTLQAWPVTVDTVILNTANVTSFYDLCTVIAISENPTASAVSIFPNPSRGSFVLKSSRHFHNARMAFRNTMGELIFTVQLGDESEQNINAEMLSAGLYFVDVMERGIIYRDKVIIIKN